jgi:uncharacterized protein with ATP-grasp and redox domains
VRQTLDSVRRLSTDEAVHKKVLRAVLKAAGDMDLRQSPPAMGQFVHRLIREETGDPDPYREVKQRQNELALALYPRLVHRVRCASDPLATALRLAAAGNVIDLGVKSGIEESQIAETLNASLEPLEGGALERFRRAAELGRDILYVGDNAGEIVLDRLLVEVLGPARVTFVVRGSPVINDAVMADAKASGMAALVKVIDSGSDAPGTILEDCSPEFCARFRDADLVLSKGQGNYETLSDAERPVFFLLRVKCAVVARHVGAEVGSLVLAENTVSGRHEGG